MSTLLKRKYDYQGKYVPVGQHNYVRAHRCLDMFSAETLIASSSDGEYYLNTEALNDDKLRSKIILDTYTVRNASKEKTAIYFAIGIMLMVMLGIFMFSTLTVLEYLLSITLILALGNCMWLHSRRNDRYAEDAHVFLCDLDIIVNTYRNFN